jgi:hypothetical protein
MMFEVILNLCMRGAHDALTLCDQICDQIVFSDAVTWRLAKEYSKWHEQKFSMVACKN